jgi:hypothetical protein
MPMGVVILAEWLDVFRLGAIATGGSRAGSRCGQGGRLPGALNLVGVPKHDICVKNNCNNKHCFWLIITSYRKSKWLIFILKQLWIERCCCISKRLLLVYMFMFDNNALRTVASCTH